MENDSSDERSLDYYGVHNLQSSVPRVCLEDDCFMGIDEAGRGPVLGRMSVCNFEWLQCFYCPARGLTEQV